MKLTYRWVVPADSAPVHLNRPAKAQLRDGSIVVFPTGFRRENHQMVGNGWRFSPTLRDSVAVTAVAGDSIAGIVAFRTAFDPAQSVGMSVAAAVSLVIAGFFALLILCSSGACDE